MRLRTRQSWSVTSPAALKSTRPRLLIVVIHFPIRSIRVLPCLTHPAEGRTGFPPRFAGKLRRHIVHDLLRAKVTNRPSPTSTPSSPLTNGGVPCTPYSLLSSHPSSL
ncbi:hypothetical protein LIA77_07638 [Sarocladium implicatum]|nr:hypothetical protein LIA77_07638 [Sarocladium implicatum]